MVIAFTHIDFFEGEADVIRQLFEKGLEKLHLKKRGTIADWKKLLQALPKKFYKKVVLHSYYDLQKEFPDLKLHSGRAEVSKNTFVSSSSHSVDEAEEKCIHFEYVFLSPIYTSLSKQKYAPKEDMEVLNVEEKSKIVALGGIDRSKLVDLKLRGFEHIALLGAIWNRPETAVENFVKIKKEWEGLEDIF